MCGIAGILDLLGRTVPEDTLAAMTDILAHRGPDDRGVWVDGAIGLGHRRLAILDPTPRGANPMAGNDPRLMITFNGEIYNMPELRSELEARGYRFRTRTDTEVVVNLYDADGPRAIERMDGMFAFALWDGREGKLLLARDRFGVKPLYWTLARDRLLFASEVKAFLPVPEFEPRLDEIGLSQHLTFMNMLGSRTLFRDVELLEAGCFLEISDGTIQRHRYWDLEIAPDNEVGDVEWAAAVKAKFQAAVRRQMLSDVPVGAFLSGGLDTTAITKVANEVAPGLNTFTCGFELPASATGLERYFDESIEARSLADHLGTKHREIRLGAEALPDSIRSVVWHLDEPRVGISYQVFHTSRMISQQGGNKVVLSGVGGDELFAGYPWRFNAAATLPADRFARDYYRLWCRLLDDEGKEALLSPGLRDSLGGYTPYEDFAAILKGAASQGTADRATYFEFKSFLNGLLVVDDKLSMAHSVEARVPFLDNALVDLARRIPIERKLAGDQGKVIFRRAMSGLLPEEVVMRRKQGFTPPDATWYRTDLRDFVRDTLFTANGFLRDLFDEVELRALVDQHMTGQHDHRFLIWSLMSLQIWGELFLRGRSHP